MKRISLSGLALRALGLAAAAFAAAPAAAQTRIDVQPYVEIRQGLSVGIDNGDTDAWTGLAAGVDARAATRRVQGQASYRYERRFGWSGGRWDDDIHNGLAQVRADLIPNTLNLNAGAMATRARGDARGPLLGLTTVDDANLVEVYGLYAGPDFSRRIGGIDVAANYRLGYIKVDDNSLRGLPLLPGQLLLDRYDSSTTHNASLSIGQGVGPLPFGWTVGAGYVREDVTRLDQEYEGRYVRGDIVLPLTHSLALTGGVGYEKIESSLQDFLRDANGLPVLTPGGNLIADPTRPRLVSFATDGVIWDAGFIWRPSRRTELQARVGRRYGGTTYTGSFRHKLSSAWAIQGVIYDSIESFGRLAIGDLAGVPVNFRLPRAGFDAGLFGLGGCVFGDEPGAGSCFDEFFQTVTASNFRNRGASVIASGARGPWEIGLAANYNNRRYLSPIARDGELLDRITAETFSLVGSAVRRLSPTSSVSVDAYAAHFDSGFDFIDGATGLGATATYRRRFYMDRLEGFGSVGLFHSSSDLADSSYLAALAGLRYDF